MPKSKLWLKGSVKSGFRKNLLVLLSGMAIAQLIPILASPVLTRFFSPESFGIFATFTAISAFALVPVTGKYELAIILPKRDEEAINILVLTVLLSFIISGGYVLIILGLGDFIINQFNVPQLSGILIMIPMLVFFQSCYRTYNEWCIRKNQFKELSRNKVINSTGVTGFSLLFGAFSIKTGLILGQILGQITAVGIGAYKIIKGEKKIFHFISVRKQRYFFKKYSNFARYLIPGQLINSLSVQLPVFFIGSQFGPETLGLYALTERILGVPLSFLGNSVRDVFKQRAAEDYKQKGNCISIYLKTTKSLLALSIIPFTALFFIAPFLFEFIFGSEWEQAGVFTQALLFMYLLSFVSMPTSWIFIIAEKQKLDLLWQVSFLILTAVSLVIGYFYDDIMYTLYVLCIGRSLAFILQMGMTYHLAKGKNS